MHAKLKDSDSSLLRSVWLGSQWIHLVACAVYAVSPFVVWLEAVWFPSYGTAWYGTAWYAACIAYLITLYTTHGSPQWRNQDFWMRLALDDSTQYLAVALNFALRSSSLPAVPTALLSFFVYAWFQVVSPFLRESHGSAYQRWEDRNRSTVLYWVAVSEVYTLAWLFAGLLLFWQSLLSSLLTLFVYVQFLQFRYAFHAQPRQVFAQLRQWLDSQLLPSKRIAPLYLRAQRSLLQYSENSVYAQIAKFQQQQHQQQHQQR